MITRGTNRKEDPAETAGAGLTAEAVWAAEEVWSVEAVKTKNCIQSNAETHFEYKQPLL